MIRWLAEKIDLYDSLRAKAKLSGSSACMPKAFRIQVEAGLIHIGKYGCGVQESDDLGGGGEGELGQTTASPVPMPWAMSSIRRASVPLAQLTA